jgi:hypothetical protein
MSITCANIIGGIRVPDHRRSGVLRVPPLDPLDREEGKQESAERETKEAAFDSRPDGITSNQRCALWRAEIGNQAVSSTGCACARE